MCLEIWRAEHKKSVSRWIFNLIGGGWECDEVYELLAQINSCRRLSKLQQLHPSNRNESENANIYSTLFTFYFLSLLRFSSFCCCFIPCINLRNQLTWMCEAIKQAFNVSLLTTEIARRRHYNGTLKDTNAKPTEQYESPSHFLCSHILAMTFQVRLRSREMANVNTYVGRSESSLLLL